MTAVILAAGLSKRFAGKKLLMKINGKPMAKHVADLVAAMDFERKVFVYSDQEVLKAVFGNGGKASGFTFVHNPRAEQGLSTSVRLALEAGAADGIMFFVGDQPFIDEDTVKKLLDAFYQKRGSIVVPVYGGRRGNPVVFSSKWIDQLNKLEGDVGGREIIRENASEVCEVAVENPQIGMDIDTEEEFYTAGHGERN